MKPLIVALDVETDKEAIQMTRHLSPWVDVFKIGPVLFLKYGGSLIQSLRATGAEIFLDLKFHDIPTVVARAVQRAAEWGVYSVTLHTTGGLEMMHQAAGIHPRPKIWGVTVLTSLEKDDLESIGVTRTVPAQVTALAKLGLRAGLDGVVSSVQEAKAIKKACGNSFTVVTPGIRFAPAGDDQKRAQTPKAAIENKADFFVMGRPIIEAKDPVAVVKSVYDSIEVPV